MGRWPNRKWSRAEINRLIDMRDVQKLSWAEIADALRDTDSNCCARYGYYHAKRRKDALRRGENPPERPAPFVSRHGGGRPKKAPARAAKSDPPPKPTRAAEIVHRPRYFHQADAEIAARIDRQGLTAGFLGDPPPGRSALDQKQSAN